MFHEGELAVQRRAGVSTEAARLEGMLAPADLRGGMSRFLAERTFAVIAGRDHGGVLWISPMTGPAGFLQARAATLDIHAVPAAGDPLHALPAGQPVGLLAIEFAIRRRVRINGDLIAAGAGGLSIAVEQAFGNCPQYIHPRHVTADAALGDPVARHASVLDEAGIALIRRADTFFLGTTHPERGVDASHRGGATGFVRVDGGDLWWPDYPGNNMFNSMGNLAVDDSAALLFVDFATGTTLQMSGSAALQWTEPGAAGDDGGTGRRVRFTPQHVITAAASGLRG